MNKHTAALLEQHFDTAFAAPGGIKKLRELILTLAMQGKLVPQDPNDPPASELLKDIETEKKRLVKNGKIKAPKPLPPVTAEEMPYALPLDWKWVRFPNCYYVIGNKTNQIQTNGYLESGAYPIIDQGKAFIAAYTNEKNHLLILEKPVIVFGDHTKNIKYVDFNFVIGADGVKTICPYDGISPRFLFRLMQSYRLIDRGYARHFGVLNEKLAPLPPLPEQHRIVAKIDQLMARCDALEKLRAAQHEKRLTVHAAAIQQLLNIAAADEHRRAQAFLTEHFSELYTVKENVTELRKAILQLAVMGKLVPQDPNDLPASQLLKDIEAEKKRLVKEGKIKAPKPLPEIKPEEAPYELPEGWEWVRLGNVGSFERGKSRHRPRNDKRLFEDGTYPFVQTGDVSKAKYSNYQITTCGSHYNELGLQQSRLWKKGTLCITIAANIAETGFLGMEACIPDSVVAFLSTDQCISKLVKVFIGVAKEDLEHYAPSTAQKNINLEIINELAFPLSPLPEQHRIVAKIDQLMALCDTLDQQIAAATNKQTALLNAVMAEV